MAKYLNLNHFNFAVGDTVAVHHKVKEAGKERIQIFEGIVIAIKGKEPENKSFTVRKIAAGNIGVERIWPIMCPSLVKVVVKKRGQTKKAKLYYLRKRVGKRALKVEKNNAQSKTKTGKGRRETRPATPS